MIYPGAVWSPGVNAGYRAGRNRMQLAVCHYTVGRDSAPVGQRGYFQFLVRRNGEVIQFAEADALCWHAGTANQWGPGIEVEYLPGSDDDLWTPASYKACAGLVEWLIGLGIPDRFYDGARVDPSGFSGFLTHRSVQQPDAHSDWWPDLPRIAIPEEDDVKGTFVKAPKNDAVYFVVDGKKIHAKTKEYVDHIAILGQSTNGWDNIRQVTQGFLDVTPDA